jgi:hypothetical protein
MRTAIEVKDLNLRQWDYVQTNVPVDGREFLPGLPTACVVLEVSPDLSALHVEMDLAEFICLMLTLEAIKNEPSTTARAVEALLSEGTGSGRDGD